MFQDNGYTKEEMKVRPSVSRRLRIDWAEHKRTTGSTTTNQSTIHPTQQTPTDPPPPQVTWEARKILGVKDLPVSCTAVRIPTLRAHSEAITIETEKPISPDKAR